VVIVCALWFFEENEKGKLVQIVEVGDTSKSLNKRDPLVRVEKRVVGFNEHLANLLFAIFNMSRSFVEEQMATYFRIFILFERLNTKKKLLQNRDRLQIVAFDNMIRFCSKFCQWNVNPRMRKKHSDSLPRAMAQPSRMRQ
jgi:hypothetical protein